jgi:hypothetical protein
LNWWKRHCLSIEKKPSNRNPTPCSGLYCFRSGNGHRKAFQAVRTGEYEITSVIEAISARHSKYWRYRKIRFGSTPKRRNGYWEASSQCAHCKGIWRQHRMREEALQKMVYHRHDAIWLQNRWKKTAITVIFVQSVNNF